MEDLKLIEAMMNLHNTGRFTVGGGFKPEFLSVVEKILALTMPDSEIKAKPHIKLE